MFHSTFYFYKLRTPFVYKTALLTGDWQNAIGVPICKGEDRTVGGNYRLARLISVVCKQIERVIAVYYSKSGNEWVLYAGKQPIRPWYSREIPVVTVCQDIADSMDEGVRIDEIITDFFQRHSI